MCATPKTGWGMLQQDVPTPWKGLQWSLYLGGVGREGDEARGWSCVAGCLTADSICPQRQERPSCLSVSTRPEVLLNKLSVSLEVMGSSSSYT